jgi:hypothetical protein
MQHSKEPIHIISLGAGVQSSTMALMASAGEITPMPVAAIFADTKAEPKAVYEWLKWLRTQLPFPTIIVSAGSLAKNATTLYMSSKNKKITSESIPAFVLNPDGSQGIMSRQCTKDFKVSPVDKEITKLMRQHRVKRAVKWLGISVDEVWRAKPCRRKTVEHRWPFLMELSFKRSDCLKWMEEHGFPKPPRSACTFCPYRSNSEWLSLTPSEFNSAVRLERRLQKVYSDGRVMEGIPWLHRSMVPLDKVDFSTEEERGQLSMFNNECEGMCGV